MRWSPITRLTNLGLRLVEGELPCIQAGRSHPPVSHSRVRCRFLGTLECTASADLGPFPSVNSSASPALGGGWKLGKGFTLYPISLLSRALRASNFTRPSARGELAYRPGFLPIKEAGTVGPLPHAFNRQRANAWFAGSTEYSIDVEVQVRLPMVCVLSLSDSGLSLSRHLRPLAAHARGMCLIHSLYCVGGPCLTLARIPSPPICSS